MTKGDIYQNVNDGSKIEIVLSQQEKRRMNKEKKEEETYMIDLPEINCKYVESATKLGKPLTFKREYFERLVKQGMFVKVC